MYLDITIPIITFEQWKLGKRGHAMRYHPGIKNLIEKNPVI
jgi:hypothetical protein